MKIKDLQKEIHALAREKGWWDEPRTLGALIALCHSELSEALEALRGRQPGIYQVVIDNGKPEGFAVELADTVIRILDIAEHGGMDTSSWVGETIAETIKYAKDYVGRFALTIDKTTETLTLPDYVAEAHYHLSMVFARSFLMWQGGMPSGEIHLAACIAVIALVSKRFDIPLEEAIRLKMEYNRTRQYRHGGKAL